MNAIEDNAYTQTWQALGKRMAKPQAILSVSAHWYTDGTRVHDAPHPKTVYDMYGFPKPLYEVKYDAPGSPALAGRVRALLDSPVRVDNGWGFDHGTWSVLCHIYPQADIPLMQLSIDGNAPFQAHYEMGKKLAALRGEGVMILGSGNVVHNLGRVSWDMTDGYTWADEFDAYIRDRVVERRFADTVDLRGAGSAAAQAFVTPEHYLPLLYVLGAAAPDDELTVFNDARTMGSLSMTGYLFE